MHLVSASHEATVGQRKKVCEGVPHVQLDRAEDLAGAAVFLASAEANCIVTQRTNVDGRQWMN